MRLTWPEFVSAEEKTPRKRPKGYITSQFELTQHIDINLPSPCGEERCVTILKTAARETTSLQALSVNAFRWRIRDERPGDGLKNFLGPRDPKRIGRA